jgi:hypothetical protein
MAERIGRHVAVGLRGATTWNDAAFSGDYSTKRPAWPESPQFRMRRDEASRSGFGGRIIVEMQVPGAAQARPHHQRWRRQFDLCAAQRWASMACASVQSSASARHTRKPVLSGGHRAACRLTVHHGADALG